MLDARVSYDLMVSVFNPETPLHDGAVIIQGDRIAAAACFLPLTQKANLSKEFGTRHRAALGISEETDALAVVVSEETGAGLGRPRRPADPRPGCQEPAQPPLPVPDRRAEQPIGERPVSEKKSLWGLRLLAVVLAVLCWFLATADRRESQTSALGVEAFINYSIPDRMMLLQSVDRVRVRISGTSSRIQNLNPFQVSVGVDLRAAEKGTVEVTLAPRDVLLPEGLEVQSIEPAQFVVELDRVVQEIRRVEPSLKGEPAAGAVVLSAEVVPPQVLISGPESLVGELQSLVTSPISLNGHALDFDERAQVISPDAKIQIVQPIVVTVKVSLEVPTVGGSR